MMLNNGHRVYGQTKGVPNAVYGPPFCDKKNFFGGPSCTEKFNHQFK